MPYLVSCLCSFQRQRRWMAFLLVVAFPAFESALPCFSMKKTGRALVLALLLPQHQQRQLLRQPVLRQHERQTIRNQQKLTCYHHHHHQQQQQQRRSSLSTRRSRKVSPTVERYSTSTSIVSPVNDDSDSPSYPVYTNTTTSGITTSSIDSSIESTTIPSYRKLIVFCYTTMLIGISEPLLSLVDSTVVGLTQQNAVVQIASLGPATTLYDSLIYFWYWLAIATTNQITKILAQQPRRDSASNSINEGTNPYRQLQLTTSHVLGVALVLGLITSSVLFIGGNTILSNIIMGQQSQQPHTAITSISAGATSGTIASLTSAAATSDVLYFATRYLWVRATAAIAAVSSFVLQSFCLATMDTWTPTLAVMTASVVNIVGDVALSSFGVIGAAIATTVANWISVSILARAVHRKMQEWKRKELEYDCCRIQVSLQDRSEPDLMVNSSLAADSVTTELSIDTPTQLANLWLAQQKAVPFVSLPDRLSFWNLVRLSGPLFFVIVAKTICYSAVTLRCTKFGWDNLAAHNIMIRIFFFYASFGDAVSTTTQSFIPRTLYPTYSPRAFFAVFKRLLVLSIIVGCFNSQISVILMQRFGSWFAKDPHIVHLMKLHAPLLGFSAFWHPIAMMLEGIVLASQNFRILVVMYIVTMISHTAILRWYSNSFLTLWHAFCVFQLLRVVLIGWASTGVNAANKRKRKEKQILNLTT